MNEKLFHKVAKDCADLVTKKNKAYGNSFERAGEILKILFPNGVGTDQYQDMLTITRVLDKLFRICSGDKKAFEENPWRDVLGYSLLSVCSEEASDVKHGEQHRKFKFGDKVKLLLGGIDIKKGTLGFVKEYSDDGTYVRVVWDEFISKSELKNKDHHDGYYENSLELVEEESGNKFKKGDRIILVNKSFLRARVGSTATVTGYDSEYVNVVWDRDNDYHKDQDDGPYYAYIFELIFKVIED